MLHLYFLSVGPVLDPVGTGCCSPRSWLLWLSFDRLRWLSFQWLGDCWFSGSRSCRSWLLRLSLQRLGGCYSSGSRSCRSWLLWLSFDRLRWLLFLWLGGCWCSGSSAPCGSSICCPKCQYLWLVGFSICCLEVPVSVARSSGICHLQAPVSSVACSRRQYLQSLAAPVSVACTRLQYLRCTSRRSLLQYYLSLVVCHSGGSSMVLAARVAPVSVVCWFWCLQW